MTEASEPESLQTRASVTARERGETRSRGTCRGAGSFHVTGTGMHGLVFLDWDEIIETRDFESGYSKSRVTIHQTERFTLKFVLYY